MSSWSDGTWMDGRGTLAHNCGHVGGCQCFLHYSMLSLASGHETVAAVYLCNNTATDGMYLQPYRLDLPCGPIMLNLVSIVLEIESTYFLI